MRNAPSHQFHASDSAVSVPVAENAIEIAMHSLEFLQDHLDLGRDALIRDYVLPWAREAEAQWAAIKTTGAYDDPDIPYYDFIDGFAAQKESEILQGRLT